MPDRTTAARLIADALVANGVERIFCVPGESYLALLDALYDTNIAVTVFRHEGGMMRAATSEPEAARLVRDFLTRNILVPIAERLEVDDAPYRAGLAMSQIAGFTLARYILGIQPLVAQSRVRLAADLGATLQRYLRDELSP